MIVDWGLWNTEGDVVHDPEAMRRDPLPTASGAITRLACAHAKEASLELEPVLKRAHITLHEIENPDARLRVRDQIQFLNLVAVALQDDFLGFHLAQPSDLREMGWLYYVAASSKIMGDALKRGARYSSIVNEGISLKYIENGEVAVTIDYVGVSRHLDRHQMELLMTALVRLCRQLTGLRLVPTRVRFTHHRESTSSEFVEFFGSDVEFSAAADEVVFATAIKTMPVVSADPYLNKLLISYFDEALSRRPSSRSSFRSSVENTIVPLLPHGKAIRLFHCCRTAKVEPAKSRPGLD